MEKASQLQKIIRAQWQFLFASFGIPALLFLLALLIPEREVTPFIPVWFFLAAWSALRLRAVDACPWCGFSFLQKNRGWRLGMGGLSIPPRKNCINCGAPSHEPVANA